MNKPIRKKLIENIVKQNSPKHNILNKEISSRTNITKQNSNINSEKQTSAKAIDFKEMSYRSPSPKVKSSINKKDNAPILNYMMNRNRNKEKESILTQSSYVCVSCGFLNKSEEDHCSNFVPKKKIEISSQNSSSQSSSKNISLKNSPKMIRGPRISILLNYKKRTIGS